jgi:hypothetical protein
LVAQFVDWHDPLVEGGGGQTGAMQHTPLGPKPPSQAYDMPLVLGTGQNPLPQYIASTQSDPVGHVGT